MKYILAFVLLFPLFTVANAQVEPLLAGFYQAESDTIQPFYVGAGWVEVVDGDYVVMETAAAEDSVSFVVSGSQLVIYRELLALDGATAEICVDALCSEFTSISSVDQKSVPIAFPVADEATVTITLISGTLRLDSFLLLAANELAQVAAPDPAREYVTLPDSTIAAIDRVINGGDIALIAFGAAQIVLLLVLVVVVAWKK